MARQIGHKDRAHILELGSGSGCIKDILPAAITSDIYLAPGLDLACSAYQIPMPEDSLDAICMLNVFHHLERPKDFLHEASRCLRPGGVLVMIEPTNGLFARLIWHFHHEPFRTGPDYMREVPNQAIPWMIFVKDAYQLPRLCPDLRLIKVQRFSAMAYIVSGGLQHPMPIPRIVYPFFALVDRMLGHRLALMQLVVLEKQLCS